MKEETKILFLGKVRTPFSCVDIVGDLKKVRHPSRLPFLGLAPIDFDKGRVKVATITSAEIDQEVDVTIYDGTPNTDEVSPKKWSATGILEVKSPGFTLDSGGSPDIVIQWPEGETAVLVLLNMEEVDKGEIKTVTFYLRYIGKF